MNSDEYRSHIDRLIREGSGEVVLNGSHAHAAIIVERMFSNARDCMEILTRKFDPRIYGTAATVEEAGLFLGEPDRACRILVEEVNEDSFGSHPFCVENAIFAESGNLEIRQIPEKIRELIEFNFAVMDDKGFRFEKDKKEAIALARFGEGSEEFVEKLKKIFSMIWEVSSPVNIREKQAA